MYLQGLEVRGLFGRFNHRLVFPAPADDEAQPSLVILHGPNGVGKTTILRMLDGIMRLDFDVFRQVPFGECVLTFSTGDGLSVTRRPSEEGRPLEVTFRESEVLLHPDRSGALNPSDVELVEAFRKTFFTSVEGITFNFIDTKRHPVPAADSPTLTDEVHARALVRTQSTYSSTHPDGPERILSGRVAKFVRDAQVNVRRFFASAEPDLFHRLMSGFNPALSQQYSATWLDKTLTEVHRRDEVHSRLGLEPEPWDFDEMIAYLPAVKDGSLPVEKLMVLATYVELLEARSTQRDLIAQRLLTFERIMSGFLLDKKITIEPREGLVIVADGARLTELQLSSGEYHLLYLMVASLATTRRGTVIAIDEPEMSMHIAWQRRLIRSLFECASRATPQFIFATHSPDIAAGFEDFLVEFNGTWD